MARPDDPASDPVSPPDHISVTPSELSDEAYAALRDAKAPPEAIALNVLLDPRFGTRKP